MIEQIKAAFAQSTATLQTIEIAVYGSEFYAYMTYEPGYHFQETHLISLIGLAQYRVVTARISDEGNLVVAVVIYPNNKAA